MVIIALITINDQRISLQSTVAEVITARHCGLRAAGVAVVVNLASGLTDKHITHDETLHYSGTVMESRHTHDVKLSSL